jgi:PKD repeat protein
LCEVAVDLLYQGGEGSVTVKVLRDGSLISGARAHTNISQNGWVRLKLDPAVRITPDETLVLRLESDSFPLPLWKFAGDTYPRGTQLYIEQTQSGDFFFRTYTCEIMSGIVAVDEGQTATNSGMVNDANNDPVTLRASVGTVINNGDGTWSWSFTTSDGPPDSQTVTITADDGNGDTAQATFALTVNNVAPTIGAISAPLVPQPVNTAVSASASFNDPGAGDTHTATWDWGDGNTSAGTVSVGTVGSDSHTYTTPGVYTVKLTVSDDDGGAGESTYQYVVVYDPNGGFVTGGGWFNSPAGAYPTAPARTGKATFGFVAKYQKGATIPTGKTEFRFETGELEFQSTSYDWLVVAGANARFKGTGTVNSSGNYGFLLTATDGQINGGGGIDKLRIKIWDKSSGVIVYDNQMGNTDDALVGTALGGGSIVIHTGKNTRAEGDAMDTSVYLPLVRR